MISDNYRLLGLVVNTIPFQYENNTVNATYSGYVEITELENLKAGLESQLETTSDDGEKLKLSDDILFVTQMIENLTRAN